MELVVPTDKVETAVPLTAGVTEGAERLQRTVGVTGEIEQVNPTAALKLLSEVTVIVEVVVLFPTTVVAEAGEADIE